MINKSIEKINAEMQKEPNNRYLEIIGTYIIDRCNSEENAQLVNDKKKNLAGCFNFIKESARKKAVNGCGVLTDSQVYDGIDEYFGFTKDDVIRSRARAEVDGSAKPEQIIQKVDLNDFFC